MTEEWRCERCKRPGPRLEEPPYPGELGREVQEKVCMPCWREWLNVQMMVINEYRVNLADPHGLRVVEDQMRQFFFGAGALPPDYVPPTPRK